jgi:hypothetical protein
MNTVIENLKKAAEMIKTNEAHVAHLQELIERQKTIIADYEKTYGSHEQAIMTQAAMQAENCMDNDYLEYDMPL